MKRNHKLVGIIGGGICGPALRLALHNVGISSILFERDSHIDQRAQGYALTILSARSQLKKLNIESKNSITTTAHYVFDPSGNIISYFGSKFSTKSENNNTKNSRGGSHFHIPRQELRNELINKLKDTTDERISCDIIWNHEFIKYRENLDSNNVVVSLKDGETGDMKEFNVNLLVGADGIYSKVRQQKIDDSLIYSGLIVLLGISPITNASHSFLANSSRVFQTVNGSTRWFSMPYDNNSYMWQLTFPYNEQDIKNITRSGQSLHNLAIQKCGNWHEPIPEIIKSSPIELLTGYGTYDRDIIEYDKFRSGISKNKDSLVTLIGDAAHPMSPFKAQGANQALIDAVSLSEILKHTCLNYHNSDIEPTKNIITDALKDFEIQMLQKSIDKVLQSRAMSIGLHSPSVLDIPSLATEVIQYLKDNEINITCGDNIDKLVIEVCNKLNLHTTLELRTRRIHNVKVL